MESANRSRSCGVGIAMQTQLTATKIASTLMT